MFRRTLPLLALAFLTPAAMASHTPPPSAVTVAGSLQSELGCPDDWQPECTATRLVYDADDEVWQASFAVPAGSWEYKAALNGSWTENYGANATPGGANIPLNLASPSTVKFYYDHGTHWIADGKTSTIATAPGSYQSEIGCPGDWQPDCLRSWLEDPDGDGTYTFERAIPAGSYEVKVAIAESWDVNYGAGGVQNGPNISFNVPAGTTTRFSYNGSSHVLTISSAAASSSHDDKVEWDGLRHDSRDDTYRAPGGAVPAGTPVRLRLRTFHGDVTSVKARLYSVNNSAQTIVPMHVAASDVSCYDAALAAHTCDFWETTLANGAPENWWYRFLVTDGSDTDYYADDTAALDGGGGAATDDARDWSYALTVYVPGFTTPAWAKSAVLYQIFPDRFRNGNPGNDPVPGAGDKKRESKDPRYAYPPDPADQILMMKWNELPEGYCRNYATPTPCGQQPRGRDYFGGDLKGVTEKLDYLRELGVTAIYFNPIFDAGSNHAYDTQDYTQIDPYFGNLDQFAKLEQEAAKRGIRLILDGVFNHLSSDSPLFDRYHHYASMGACESTSSPYYAWFTFRPPSGSEPAACAGGMFYNGWFGFDSIPVLTKSLPAVQSYFVTGPNAIAKIWPRRGADGWRMDVSGDPSFPAGYWESFRSVVEAESPDLLTVSETWQKDSTLLRMVRGDRLDTTMNYRLRDAVLGLLAPGSFDPKGFADSGSPITPTQFASRLQSTYEDLAPEAAAVLMNLIDSHDTERALWTLTPGIETPAAREQNPANVAEGKERLRLATLIQFGVPGAPQVYYGDEAGVTGDDDPDDRRTYPWADLGGSPDTSLIAHYKALTAVRRDTPALTQGSFRVLSASDADGTVAFVRQTPAQAAIVAVNRSAVPHTIDLAAAMRGTPAIVLSAGTAALAASTLTLGPRSGAIVVSNGDFAPPAATSLSLAGEGDGSASLSWSAVAGAAGYDLYRSPLRGGGYVKVNGSPLTGTSYTDTGLRNATRYYYVVRALDSAGNASERSNEVEALPHLTIGWSNLQWPPSMTHTVSVVDRTDNAYGQVWIDGATASPGPTPGLTAQLGFGPDGSDPAVAGWTWVDAVFNTQAGNNDEFVASMLPEAAGTFDYAYRYSTTGGRDWVYADLDGSPNGYSSMQAGSLEVNGSGDASAPATPAGLHVVTASPDGIELAWNAVSGDPSLYGYEVRRGEVQIARVTGTSFTDTDVTQGTTYSYTVRSVDYSFNRSAPSAPVSATAELRTVTLTFNVAIPPPVEDAVGKSVYIAGFLDRLDGGLPQWDPAGVRLTRVDDTHWTITFTGKETTQLEYKYTLGSWDFVEKDGACGEIANRQLTLSYGTSGAQVVNDTVPNWRNVTPCGN